MYTEKIRVIEVRSCGKCPHSFFLDEWFCQVDGGFILNADSISPSCPLMEIEVPLQTLIYDWNKNCSGEHSKTGYNKELINDETHCS